MHRVYVNNCGTVAADDTAKPPPSVGSDRGGGSGCALLLAYRHGVRGPATLALTGTKPVARHEVRRPRSPRLVGPPCGDHGLSDPTWPMLTDHAL